MIVQLSFMPGAAGTRLQRVEAGFASPQGWRTSSAMLLDRFSGAVADAWRVPQCVRMRSSLSSMRCPYIVNMRVAFSSPSRSAAATTDSPAASSSDA